MLRHWISANGTKVDKAKIQVVEKLPPPVSVKGVHNFLGHGRFYRYFIKDFSKNMMPFLTSLMNAYWLSTF